MSYQRFCLILIKNMNKFNPILYNKFAKYYDTIYSEKNYYEEVCFIDNLIKGNFLDNKKCELLELASGTGNHSIYFVNLGYALTGVDISEDMIKIASSKCPQAQYLCHDMINFKLNNNFDVITLLFTSINYCVNEQQLIDLFQNVFQTLREGGVFIFDLGLTHIRKKSGSDIFMENYISKDLDIARISQWKAITFDRSKFKVTYTTIIKNKKGIIDFASDIHLLGAYDIIYIFNLLKKTGFREINLFDGFTKNSKNIDDRFKNIPVFQAIK